MKTLYIENKPYKRIKKIGTGLFSWAYLLDNNQVLILQKTGKKHDDITKLALSEYLTNDNIKHLPEIEYIGNIWYCGFRCEVFIMPKYQKLTNKHIKPYLQYKKLLEIYNECKTKFVKEYGYTRVSGYSDRISYAVLDELTKLGKQYQNIKDAIYCLITAISNYDDPGYFNLDLHKGNVMIDASGNLILLDIFCDIRAVGEYYKDKK